MLSRFCYILLTAVVLFTGAVLLFIRARNEFFEARTFVRNRCLVLEPAYQTTCGDQMTSLGLKPHCIRRSWYVKLVHNGKEQRVTIKDTVSKPSGKYFSDNETKDLLAEYQYGKTYSCYYSPNDVVNTLTWRESTVFVGGVLIVIGCLALLAFFAIASMIMKGSDSFSLRRICCKQQAEESNDRNLQQIEPHAKHRQQLL